METKHCPFFKSPCLGSRCAMWAPTPDQVLESSGSGGRRWALADGAKDVVGVCGITTLSTLPFPDQAKAVPNG